MTSGRFLDASRLDAALDLLGRALEVIAPVVRRTGEAPRLERLPAAGRVALEPLKPLLPLKACFLGFAAGPEEICRFTSAGPQAAVQPAPAPARGRLVVGALPCDLAALSLLDRVFLADPADEGYRLSRERTAVAALACTGEGPECFCAAAGVDPLRPAGADALFTPIGGGFLVEARTAKGEAALAPLAELLRPPAPAELGAAAGLASSSRARPDLRGPAGGWQAAWASPLWAETAARCLGCGVCTVLCPTCHCFDVFDSRDGGRSRAWDSCLSCGFTRMASGENPRAAAEARVRQRFLHKLAYFPERFGALACVGCGRCSRACPAGVRIEEIAATLAAGGEDDG